ncbi:MBL fold metallo-hydrolase [Longimycelium tulufanense]|uniref:MBL fold metallo-hydrolase n=1 Tax=Longimycelium tulufanense TaxID=907463 RepID=A0A8J3CAN7_9PSEU|nr:MBL fold metallo-hydrolase [Longimycelium tulufanense]GGM38301.1 MBL fold metallo-hydrolase [Longimycelium tulufanense]
MSAETTQIARTFAAALPATVTGSFRPRQPSAAELAAITSVASPPATGGVRVHAITQNAWAAPTAGVAEGTLRPLRTRLTVGAFLVEHPSGPFLVDAGVCADVRTRHLTDMHPLLRPILTGSPPRVGLANAIRDTGFDPAELQFVLLTHVHWDHLSGLAELPGTPVKLSEAELHYARDTGTFRPCVLPSTLKDVRFQPVPLDGPPALTFRASHDLFDDGTVLLCDLPGHTPGHAGVLLTLHSGRRVLLAGDAVWHTTQISHARQRPVVLSRIVDTDPDTAYNTVLRLHRLPGDITVLPAHDLTTIEGAFAHGPLT